MAQLAISLHFKPQAPPSANAKTYPVSAFLNGHALRITEVQEPETDFGHYCMHLQFSLFVVSSHAHPCLA
jgi:hypothetical protein